MFGAMYIFVRTQHQVVIPLYFFFSSVFLLSKGFVSTVATPAPSFAFSFLLVL